MSVGILFTDVARRAYSVVSNRLLKASMDQCFLAVYLHADEAVGTVGFDDGLLGVDHAV